MPIHRKPEWKDMQGLILSGYPGLPAAQYLPLTIDRPEDTRAWLRTIVEGVTDATRRVNDRNVELAAHPTVNLNIAFSYTGLRKLVEIGDAEKTFVRAFVDGISGDLRRSRILGDVAENHPSTWAWGGPNHPTDLLLMVFARDATALQNAVQNALTGSGTAPAGQGPPSGLLQPPLDKREHFGFVDGKSQPILKGTADAERYPDSIHVTPLGEFVFGYPDGANAIASGPRLDGCPGFGDNGTYLVFRQLQQHVAEFWNFVYGSTRAPHRDDDAEELASKIVGRRRDGRPLVPSDRHDDNEFDFRDDPDGFACPIGAHIRRANPRRSLDGPSLPHDAANRHRLLRRGRPYGEPPADRRTDDGRDRGLLFLALNNDFERQFEFIHENWVNSWGFSSLERERDPLVGLNVSRRFTIPGSPARARFAGLRRFVTVRGGEYFFLPGMAALRYLGRP
jgi:Dyp-type peroxidase family